MREETPVSLRANGCNACCRRCAFAKSSCHFGSPTRNIPRKSVLEHLGRGAVAIAAIARASDVKSAGVYYYPRKRSNERTIK